MMNGPHLFGCLAILFFCLMLCQLCTCQPDNDDSDDSSDDDDNDDNDSGDDDDDNDDDDIGDDDDTTPICPEIVEGGRVGQDGSWAVLDSAGGTVVVTTKAGELVLFTSADGLTWTMQHILGRCAGFLPRDPQIGLAGDDTPNVVFFDENSEELVHVWRDGESWEHESLNDYHCTGDFSLAVDADGAAHLAYYTKDGFFYATNRDGAWVNETLLSSNFQLRDTHLALDANDDPRIAYLNSERAIVLAMHATKGWNQQTIDDQPYEAVTMGIDADGHNHLIALTRGPDNGELDSLNYFHDCDDEWSEHALFEMFNTELSPIVFADGRLYFGVVSITSIPEPSWGWLRLEQNGDYEMVTGISQLLAPMPACSQTGNGITHCLHIDDYSDSDFLDLTNIDGDWENLVVDETVIPDYSPSQTIDHDGRSHLVYFEEPGREFHHAVQSDNQWTVAAMGDGFSPLSESLLTGADGKLYAAFRHETQPVVAVYDDGAWSYTTVETTAEVTDLTLALDNEDRLHLALCDYGNEALLVLQLQGATWNEIYSAPIKCSGLQLLFDHNNVTHLWYAYNQDTYYITDAGGTWNKQLLQADAHPTARPLLTSDGQVHLLTIGDGALRHFAGAPDTMQSEELVLLEDNMGFSPGFARDADDTLYVTVREDNHLALLTGTFGDWQTATFPEWGEVEIYSTVSVDADGNCRLAWLADGALWFATMPRP